MTDKLIANIRKPFEEAESYLITLDQLAKVINEASLLTGDHKNDLSDLSIDGGQSWVFYQDDEEVLYIDTFNVYDSPLGTIESLLF